MRPIMRWNLIALMVAGFVCIAWTPTDNRTFTVAGHSCTGQWLWWADEFPPVGYFHKPDRIELPGTYYVSLPPYSPYWGSIAQQWDQLQYFQNLVQNAKPKHVIYQGIWNEVLFTTKTKHGDLTKERYCNGDLDCEVETITDYFDWLMNECNSCYFYFSVNAPPDFTRPIYYNTVSGNIVATEEESDFTFNYADDGDGSTYHKCVAVENKADYVDTADVTYCTDGDNIDSPLENRDPDSCSTCVYTHHVQNIKYMNEQMKQWCQGNNVSYIPSFESFYDYGSGDYGIFAADFIDMMSPIYGHYANPWGEQWGGTQDRSLEMYELFFRDILKAAMDANQPDSDGDGVPDYEDNCRDAPNYDQDDTDHDGIGDLCDLFPSCNNNDDQPPVMVSEPMYYLAEVQCDCQGSTAGPGPGNCQMSTDPDNPLIVTDRDRQRYLDQEIVWETNDDFYCCPDGSGTFIGWEYKLYDENSDWFTHYVFPQHMRNGGGDTAWPWSWADISALPDTGPYQIRFFIEDCMGSRTETDIFYISIDSDGDSIPDTIDNCPAIANAQQLDADTDGVGDVCDTTPGCGGCGMPLCEKQAAVDTDKDLWADEIDNCPNTCNSQQLDADTDGIGDVCDTTPGCGGCGQVACEVDCMP